MHVTVYNDICKPVLVRLIHNPITSQCTASSNCISVWLPHSSLLLRPRSAEREVFAEVEAIKKIPVCNEPWLVTESLPFGKDVDPTLLVDLTGDLPAEVGLMLQKQETAETQKDPIEKVTAEGTSSPTKAIDLGFKI